MSELERGTCCSRRAQHCRKIVSIHLSHPAFCCCKTILKSCLAYDQMSAVLIAVTYCLSPRGSSAATMCNTALQDQVWQHHKATSQPDCRQFLGCWQQLLLYSMLRHQPTPPHVHPLFAATALDPEVAVTGHQWHY